MRLSLGIAAGLAVCLGCGGSSSPSSPSSSDGGFTVVGLQLRTNTNAFQTSATMRVNESLEVYPVVLYQNGGAGEDAGDAVFASSNPTILTAANGGRVVNCQGAHSTCRLIKANASGSAVVTYTNPRYPGLSTTFPVAINP